MKRNDIVYRGEFQIGEKKYTYALPLSEARVYIHNSSGDRELVFGMAWLQLTGAEARADEEKVAVDAAVHGAVVGFLEGERSGINQIQAMVTKFAFQVVKVGKD